MRTGRTVWVVAAALCCCTGLTHADTGARVTFATKEVQVRGARGATSPLTTGEILGAGVTVENGAKARSEVTFVNRTVARLGSNTSVLLKDGTGTIELRDGAVLFQIPKGASGEITTAPISITSKGATGMLERNGNLYIKCLLLEGELRVSIPGELGESIVLEPGQLIILNPKAKTLPGAVDFNIARAIETCRLLNEFPPLRGGTPMADAAQKQAGLVKSGDYVSAHLVIIGRGTQVRKDAPMPGNSAGKKPATTPQPRK